LQQQHYHQQQQQPRQPQPPPPQQQQQHEEGNRRRGSWLPSGFLQFGAAPPPPPPARAPPPLPPLPAASGGAAEGHSDEYERELVEATAASFDAPRHSTPEEDAELLRAVMELSRLEEEERKGKGLAEASQAQAQAAADLSEAVRSLACVTPPKLSPRESTATIDHTIDRGRSGSSRGRAWQILHTASSSVFLLQSLVLTLNGIVRRCKQYQPGPSLRGLSRHAKWRGGGRNRRG
jgi:hypothetical protein